jgi:hypothetical protein
LKHNTNPAGRLNQWLAHKELERGVQRDDESAQLFVNNQKELVLLASTFRSNSTQIQLIRVESMSRGAALGAALITWLKDTEETVEVARKVEGAVWPQLCR